MIICRLPPICLFSISIYDYFTVSFKRFKLILSAVLINMKEDFFWENFQQLLKKKTNELEKQQKRRYRKPETPKLVLSIIGDSKSFVPKPWMASVFKQGLIETAKGAKGIFMFVDFYREKESFLNSL